MARPGQMYRPVLRWCAPYPRRFVAAQNAALEPGFSLLSRHQLMYAAEPCLALRIVGDGLGKEAAVAGDIHICAPSVGGV
ncbi:hypothetical protein GCM10009712_16450 [Pseudarthrobacter sulfonivorans]